MHDRALERIRSELGLEPVEFPTTRRQGGPAERAADLMAAFADPSIAGILATIGGDDELTVLKHLDPELVRRRPIRFLGYSDNTNLLAWLWFHGIAGIYGGSTQVHLGPGPAIDPEHLVSLRAALFGGDVTLTEPVRTRDVGLPWSDPRCLTDPPPDLPADPWTWSGPATSVTGISWGGCVSIVQWQLGVSRWIRPTADHEGMVLMLELSEEMPPPDEVYAILRTLGERGLIEQASALVWARPPVSDDNHPITPSDAATRRSAYRDAVLRAVAEYQPELVVALDVDFGHTCPQWLLPYGGRITVDGAARRIVAHFDPH